MEDTYVRIELEALGEAFNAIDAIADVLYRMNTETASQGTPKWCGNGYLVSGLELGIQVIAKCSMHQLAALREHMEDWPRSLSPFSKEEAREREFVLLMQKLPEARREELYNKLMELRSRTLEEEREKEEARRREARKTLEGLSDAEQEKLYRELSEVYNRPQPGE